MEHEECCKFKGQQNSGFLQVEFLEVCPGARQAYKHLMGFSHKSCHAATFTARQAGIKTRAFKNPCCSTTITR